MLAIDFLEIFISICPFLGIQMELKSQVKMKSKNEQEIYFAGSLLTLFSERVNVRRALTICAARERAAASKDGSTGAPRFWSEQRGA